MLFQLEWTLFRYFREYEATEESMISLQEALNLTMSPLIVVMFVWSINAKDEATFYFIIPLLLLICYYLNILCVISLGGNVFNYYVFIAEYIQFISYCGLIFIIGSTMTYYFVIFPPILCFLAIILCIRFLYSKLYQESNIITFFYYLFYFIVCVLTHTGVDLKAVTKKSSYKELSSVSKKTIVYIVFIKLLTQLSLLIPILLGVDDYISMNKDHISEDFILAIVVMSSISIAILLCRLFIYIIKPLCFEDDFVEIESLENLKKYNESFKTKKLNCDDISYISIFVYSNDLEEIQKNELEKEQMYALLFNFERIPFDIFDFGKREIQNNGLVITFTKQINLQDLEQVLINNQLSCSINEIVFSQVIEEGILIKLIKLLDKDMIQMTVISENMSISLLNLQKDNNELKQQLVFSKIIIQKYFEEYIPVNPKQFLYDIYEY